MPELYLVRDNYYASSSNKASDYKVVGADDLRFYSDNGHTIFKITGTQAMKVTLLVEPKQND